jgi:hypothetical protein
MQTMENRLNIVVLDDYLHLSQKSGDWSKLESRCEITVFDRRLGVPDEAAEVLKPFHILALVRERIYGAGLDVYDHEPLADDHPLGTLRNVVLTPHLGYAVQEFFNKAYGDTVDNISAFVSGKPTRVLTPERNDSSLVR